MVDLIAITAVLAILAVAGGYVYKQKKAGAACIGCPHSCSCGKKGCH